MARKPNYKFERMERDRAKAAKKAARLQAKKDRAERKLLDGADAGEGDHATEDPGDRESDLNL